MVDKKIRIILDSSGAKKNADDLNKSVVGVGKSADNAAFAMKSLAAAIAGVISTQKIIEYADAWTSVQNQLRRVTETNVELIGSSAELLGIANQTRSSFEATASLYTSLAIATEKLGESQETAAQITRTINNLTLESGKTAEQTAGAIFQLGQAFDKGVLNGDEFVSVSEGMPGILRAIELQTGKTRAEIKKMSEDGELDIKLLAESLKNYGDEAQIAADKTKATFGQNLTIARNNAIAFVGASEAISLAVSTAGSAIVGLSENINTLVEIAGAAAAIYVARLIPSVVAYGAATLVATRATLTAVPAVTGLSAALGIQARAATASTVAMNGMAATAGVLRGALAFLGGPLGVAFLAASALLYFGSSAEKVTLPIDQLTASVEGLTNAQRELRKLEINKAFDEQIKIIEDASKKVTFLQDILTRGTFTSGEGLRVTNEQLVIQRARLDDARQSAEKLVESLGRITAPSSTGTTKPAATEPAVIDPKTQKEIDQRNEAIKKAAEAADSEIRGAESVTAALQRELETRTQISQFYRDAKIAEDRGYFEQERALLNATELERIALINQREAEDTQRREEQLRQALDTLNLEESQKLAIRQAYKDQELAAEQVYEEQRTAIAEEGIRTRQQLDEMEKMARMQSFADLGAALLSLGQGQSRKVFEVGKALSLAQATVSLPSAVIKSFENGGGYPWGLAPAAAMLATGLKNIQTIRSTKLGGGGGSASVGGGGGGSTGGGGSLPTTTGTQEQFQQRRVIDIRGIDKDSLISGQQLVDILASDDNVIVALNGAQQDAQRRGVI